MLPILRRTRHLTVAGMAAGTLLTAGLVGQLARHADNPAAGTVPSEQASSDGGSASSSSSSTPSSGTKTYSQVPSVNGGGTNGSDSNSRGS